MAFTYPEQVHLIWSFILMLIGPADLIHDAPHQDFVHILVVILFHGHLRGRTLFHDQVLKLNTEV
jgi:hypothetical protein